jgi:hypothetical protein
VIVNQNQKMKKTISLKRHNNNKLYIRILLFEVIYTMKKREEGVIYSQFEREINLIKKIVVDDEWWYLDLLLLNDKVVVEA